MTKQEYAQLLENTSSKAMGYYSYDGRLRKVVLTGNPDGSIDIEMRLDKQKIYATTYNQPKFHSRPGMEESLSMSTQKPELPKTSKELTAYAEFALNINNEDYIREYKL